MSYLALTYCQRIGVKNMPITVCPDDPDNLCYIWSTGGSGPVRKKDGVKIVRFVCTGCRSLHDKGLVSKRRNPLPVMKADVTNKIWVDAKPNNRQEANAWDVHCGTQPPRQQLLLYIQLTNELVREEQEFDIVLQNQATDSQFRRKLILHLM